MPYEAEELKRAISIAASGNQPISLLVLSANRYRHVQIAYTGGLRYPHLERIAASPDRLNAILVPRR